MTRVVRRWRPYCAQQGAGPVLYLPFYAYGLEQPKIWDISGNNNHGTIYGAAPGTYPMLSGAELVSNGGMESGNPPTGWIPATWISPPGTFERSEVQKHSGDYSTHIIDYGFYKDPRLTFVLGKQYKVSFWYYLVSGSIDVVIYDGDGGTVLSSTNYSSPTEDWTYATVIVTSVIGGDLATVIFMRASAEFYIDDVSIQEVTGYEGLGWGFDGIDDVVTSVALSELISAPIGTILVWFRPPVTSSIGATSYDLPSIIGGINGYMWISQGQVPAGTDRIWVGNYDGNEDKYGITYTPNQWIQIGWLHSGGTLYGYKNGVLDGSIASGNTGSLADALRVGSGVGNVFFFKGQIGEVLVFNRALSAQEIRAFYELTRSKYGV